mmetsp:Transcript_41606/g.114691  ORF Transcript_41606/g.114691 Transcript_41606/m.114691 type:complete len:211 (-) Transcript_41606:962-1594(-)
MAEAASATCREAVPRGSEKALVGHELARANAPRQMRVAASPAVIRRGEGRWEVDQNPLDLAIVVPFHSAQRVQSAAMHETELVRRKLPTLRDRTRKGHAVRRRLNAKYRPRQAPAREAEARDSEPTAEINCERRRNLSAKCGHRVLRRPHTSRRRSAPMALPHGVPVQPHERPLGMQRKVPSLDIHQRRGCEALAPQNVRGDFEELRFVV